MINSKITTDIMTTTGFTLDIPPAKVVINNQEITDLKTFNKVVDSVKEKDKEIERLNNIIDELEYCIENSYGELGYGIFYIFRINGKEECFDDIKEVKKVIKELKGSNKE